MRADLRARWREESIKLGGQLKKPLDLLRRRISPEDFADTAVIGGISVADLVAGKVSEWQIPNNVETAFHAQYPGVSRSFVDEVNQLSGHPEQIQGFINGVKGKLFEIDYVSWLNHGHLPDGLTAELAQRANNPGWDIVIHDAHGNIDAFLQMKATSSVAYVHEAIMAHPNIDVVVPHDLYDQLSRHPEFIGHLIDSNQHLSDLTAHVSDGVQQAEAAGIHFHIPVLAFVFVAGQNCMRYRKGEMSLASALQNFGERSLLAVVASGVGWGVSLLVNKTIIGIPFAMTTRMFGGQLLHNRDRRKILDMRIEIVRSSRKTLQLQIAKSS